MSNATSACALSPVYGTLSKPDLTFIVPYLIVAAVALVLNSLILVLAWKRPDSLSKRRIFRRLLIILAATDLTLAAAVVANVGLYLYFYVETGGQLEYNPEFNFERYVVPYVHFVWPRDVLIGTEMACSLLLSVDRAVAVFAPTHTARWSPKSVTILVAVQLLWLTPLSGGVCLWQAYTKDCETKVMLEHIIKVFNVLLAATFFFASTVCYAAIFSRIGSCCARPGQRSIFSGKQAGHMMKISLMLLTLAAAQLIAILPFSVHYFRRELPMNCGLFYTYLLGCAANPIILLAFKPDVAQQLLTLACGGRRCATSRVSGEGMSAVVAAVNNRGG